MFSLYFSLCREWVLKSSLLIAMAVYTYLRLIVDHHGTSQLQVLRQKEVDFCISLLRERVSASRDGWEEGPASWGSCCLRVVALPVFLEDAGSPVTPSLCCTGSAGWLILRAGCEWVLNPFTPAVPSGQAVGRGRAAVLGGLPHFSLSLFRPRGVKPFSLLLWHLSACGAA